MQMKLGSLFDGSGGFPLAGAMFGIEPVWASEVEPFPIRVTSLRFPGMKHLGDVTKINGAEIEPVDIITFGSPCQDLSIAGKQAGIHDGERSNLFFEAIRIIKEMRNATANKFPRFAIWENVPGAFSSNGGDDFRAVLQSFCSIIDDHADVTRPPDGVWQSAGCVLGDGYSVAWRVLDAQYFGVPQRRKRVFALADLGSERAGQILFESESMQWDSETGREAWERASKYVAGCPDGGCELQWMKDTVDHGTCYAIEGNGSRPSHMGNGYSDSGIMYTLNTIEQHSVCYDEAKKKCYAIENHPNDSRVTVDPNGIVQTLSSRMGTGGNNTPFVLITSTNPGSQSGNCIEQQHLGHSEEASTEAEKASFVSNSSDRVMVKAYTAGNGQLDNAVISPICSTLDCMHDQKMVIIEKEGNNMDDRKYILRRLTPLECARLQGFPDWWCDGAGGSDTAKYKMWGNGVALPCVAFIMRRIVEEVDKHGNNE